MRYSHRLGCIHPLRRFKTLRRSLVTWQGGEVQMNAACFTALLKAWPRGNSRLRVTSDDDDVVLYKQPADPYRYLEVIALF